jgi:flavin reductase (DIM6/NTAB) family NADH-FMN oxidoreductase RutF
VAEFRQISPSELNGNVFDLIGRQWMLVSAGDKAKFNMMTASWGGLGVLWGLPVSFIFIRPQRYTDTFIKGSERYALNFFDEKYRPALQLCGSRSGRDCDKAAETGLKPVFDEGAVYFEQAKLVVVCRKLYMDDIKPGCFLDRAVDEKNYPAHDYHNVYVGEVEKILVR